MRRKVRRVWIKTWYRLCRMHKRFGTGLEISHLTYFGVLAVESKYMYAKVGLVCMALSILYMISEKDSPQ